MQQEFDIESFSKKEIPQFVVLHLPQYRGTAFNFFHMYSGIGSELKKYFSSQSINGYVPIATVFNFFDDDHNSLSNAAMEHRELLTKLSLDFINAFFSARDVNAGEVVAALEKAQDRLTTAAAWLNCAKNKLSKLQITGDAEATRLFFEFLRHLEIDLAAENANSNQQ